MMQPKEWNEDPLHIVGLGASAGGLEALRDFLRHVPRFTGLAYVVVQHRAMESPNLLVELLQQVTELPVQEAVHHAKVLRNHVYVAPPGSLLSLRDGLFAIVALARNDKQRQIDYFFKALALDQKRKSIGVVLSGMGSDGLEGIEAIHLQGGKSFAQTPDTALYSDMPTHAIASGFIDQVATAAELSDQILELSNLFRRSWNSQILVEIFEILRKLSGHDFSNYKRGTINRRINRRMMKLGVVTLEAYLPLLQADRDEQQRLYKELLIGVTSFFRDPGVWHQLQDLVIPKLLLTNHPSAGMLRAWVVGCATGEEAYSLAMVFRALMDDQNPAGHYSLQIFATDLDPQALEKARLGVYPKIAIEGMMNHFGERFFTIEGQNVRVVKEIRDMILFARHNIVHDPPFTKLDLISCRNLLIYFDNPLQKKVMQFLHYGLKPTGYLLLGSAETTGLRTDLFVQQAGPGRFFQKKTVAPFRLQELASSFYLPKECTLDYPKNPHTRVSEQAVTFEYVAGQLLLQEYTPAALLATENGEILYISGRTGRYLEPPAGKANWNLFALARGGVNHALNEAFHRAIREKKVISVSDVRVGSDDDMYITDISVRPLREPDVLRDLLLVLFTDRGRFVPESIAPVDRDALGNVDPHVEALLAQLQRTQEALADTRQEMQISQEELKSINEELQTSNEELQSTNEELTTSREEIQSINEELQTVNAELHSKVDELSHTSNDMKNLLNSTDIATLFLDERLHIRRFTEQAINLFNLIPSDAGRPITDLVSVLLYPDMAADAWEVLKTLTFKEKQVPATELRWFTVRIMPYRTTDNRIDGVVMTFINITLSKQLESDLRSVHWALSQAFDSAEIGMAILSADGRWLHANRFLCELLGFTEGEIIASKPVDLFDPADQPLFHDLRKLLDGQEENLVQSCHCRHRLGHVVPVQVEALVIRSSAGKPDGVLLRIQCKEVG